jgi:cell division protein FtsN
MSRDFAKKSRGASSRRSSSDGHIPGWLWFIGGLALGAFTASLYFLKNPAAPIQIAAIEKPKPVENELPKPRFDFYKLLQESETTVPASESFNEDKTEDDKTTSAQTSTEYILQVGSFPNQTDADKLRAQLLLLNLAAHIEKVEIRKGEVWHRVLVGPFENQAALTSARTQLVNNQYNIWVLKRAKK